MKSKLFITKNYSELQLLTEQLPNYEIVAHSFLSFEKVKSSISLNYDVIFFSSIRSIHYFLAQQAIKPGIQLACIGQRTATYLIEKGYAVDFIGEEPGNPDQVAADFKVWLEQRKVLFPISSLSNKSIAQQFQAHQKEEVIVYQTNIVPKKIESCNTYVFTSPSNFEGFKGLNTIDKASTVIAWGKTTQQALMTAGIECDHCLTKASLEELVEVLNGE